ncbi:MAG: hypothetical protein MK214_20585 [Thalassotalea sp.]|nr:hypothetical protein [Thalassotalea sp.]
MAQLIENNQESYIDMDSLSQQVDADVMAQLGNELSPDMVKQAVPSMSHNRFDVALKLYFLEGLMEVECSEFRRACYREHIRAFSDGTFSEPNNPEKNTYADFEQTFVELYDNIKEQGFNPRQSLIPLAKDGSILNGAHRTAVSILLARDTSVLQTSLPSRDFGYQYFKHRGITPAMLDRAAQTFIDYDDKSFLAFVWPAAQGHEQAIQDLLPKLVYSTTVSLDYNGAHNILAQAYSKEPWLGAEADNYPGIKNKLVQCFPRFDDVRVYLFRAESLEDVLVIKEQVRAVFNIGKHAIHITDTKEEAIRLGELVFNANARHFLSHAKPRAFASIALQKDEVKKTKQLLDEQVSLHIYGLKALEHQENNDFLADLDVISALTKIPPHELNDNPDHFFFYNGMKLMSLTLVERILKLRDTEQDQRMLQLVQPLMKGKQYGKYLDQVKSRFYIFKLSTVINIKVFVADILRKLGLFHIIKRLLGRS